MHSSKGQMQLHVEKVFSFYNEAKSVPGKRSKAKDGLTLYLGLLCDNCLGLERQETSRRQMKGQSEGRTDITT